VDITSCDIDRRRWRRFRVTALASDIKRGTAMKRTLLLALVAVAMSVTLAAAARADVRAGIESRAYVVSYVWVTYNVQNCDGYSKYQLWMIEYRWYREYLNRGVRTTTNYGQFGTNCTNREHDQRRMPGGPSSYQVCWAPCTGGDPHWSESYIHFAWQWPYLGSPAWFGDAYAGAYAKTEVFNRNTGATLAVFCNRAMAIGSIGC
jgi:hypothetical protein